MRIVQKYGGSSLADPQKILRAAKRAAALAQKGNQMVVVVSAQGDTTDELIAKAHTVSACPSLRELDACLAVGEQLSAALMAMAIGQQGVSAVSLAGWQAGVCTESVHGDAGILGLSSDRIQRELEKGNVVVVTGFQGVDTEGNITTLGRGGSDTTAVALAAFLQADTCQIYTDVDGVYDKDPHKYPDAFRFSYVNYETMLALIRDGAQVLHDRSVEFARRYGIPVEVLSSFEDKPGTVVGP